MVKNTIGGKKGKTFANKDSSSDSEPIRFAQSSLETYACVTKVFGAGMFQVTTNDNLTFTAHLRGKMKGSHKRHNYVQLFSIVLIGFRDWENPYKNVDILFLFNPFHIHILSLSPHIPFSLLLHIHNNQHNSKLDSLLDSNDINLLEDDSNDFSFI